MGIVSVFTIQGFKIRVATIIGVSNVNKEMGWDNEIHYCFAVHTKTPADVTYHMHFPTRFEALTVRAAIKGAWFDRMEKSPPKGYRVIW